MTIPTKAARLASAAAAAAMSAPALAHPGHGETLGLWGGLLHPLTGLDHLAAMLMVGLLASRMPGARRWAMPATFVAALAAGFGAARAGIGFPAEPVIAASLVGLPLLLLAGDRILVAAQVAAVALFGFAHGFAHGAEAAGDVLPFFVGMAISTALLHAAGLTVGLRLPPRARTAAA